MKKIVALVLSLVMVLGLATTAFGAITLWAPNGSTEMCDIYDGEYNVKQVNNVAVTFHPAVALKLDKYGVAANVANIAYYTIEGSTDYFVMVNSIPADADASDYILVKAHTDLPAVGEAMINQSAADAYYILKVVDYVHYTMTGSAFTTWSDDCEAYADPELYVGDEAVAFFTLNNKSAGIADLSVKYAETTANAGNSAYMALVGGEVVVVGDPVVAATQHSWRASKWDAKGNATEYTCANPVCKTVGTVINASINAPAGAKIDKLVDGTLIAYTKGVTTPAGDKVQSAQTFDAGIAMYVGMSVMAAAGSAVVLKKKD